MAKFDLFRSVANRFFRGYASGALGAMAAVLAFNGKSLADLEGWFTSLLLASVVGGVSGGVLALDKWIRAK